jgi:hypothetical protein
VQQNGEALWPLSCRRQQICLVVGSVAVSVNGRGVATASSSRNVRSSGAAIGELEQRRANRACSVPDAKSSITPQNASIDIRIAGVGGALAGSTKYAGQPPTRNHRREQFAPSH